MKEFVLLFFLFFILGHQVLAQSKDSNLRDLFVEIRKGNIEVENLHRSSISSGIIIHGELKNTTRRPIRISTILGLPMYLINDNERTDMLAVGICKNDSPCIGIDKSIPFIELPPGNLVKVQFLAYCVNFEKEAPRENDKFSILDRLPSEVIDIAIRIADYHRFMPNKDITKAAQIALWLDQGVHIEEIRKRLKHSYKDEKEAYAILTQNLPE